MNRVGLYLVHMLECIATIEEARAGGWAAVDASRVLQTSILHNLQLLAESSKRLPPDAKARHPEVDWQGMIGLRNRIVHEYFEVDEPTVKSIVDIEIPLLKKALTALKAHYNIGDTYDPDL